MSAPPPPQKRSRAGKFVAVALVYLTLLAISHAVRRARIVDPVLPADLASAELSIVGADPEETDKVRIAFLDLGADRPGLPVLVLLHGSPGSHRDFLSMLPTLTRDHRVVVPDLPGFGSSRGPVPYYSFRAHADYVLQLLDHLDIADAHFVGFSMGNGVALSCYDHAPGRLRSLTLLSAIGAQEFELFGDYRMNHLVHGLQLAAIGLVQEAVPHMGLLDGSMLSYAYARNFYDSDQRPLRGVLERFEAPLLIVHGRNDFLVSPETAIEHARITPHSELQMVEAGHFRVFNDGEQTANRVATFAARVEAGQAPRRAAAGSARIRQAQEPFDPGDVPAFNGIALILMLSLIALATFVSEDLTCIAAGLLASQGRISFVEASVACAAGIYVGDLLVFLAGRYLGRPAIARAPLRWFVRPELVESSSQWFRRRGPIVIAISRFVPGTRLPTYLAAGLLRTNFWKFCVYFFVAVVLWTPVLVGMAMILGERAFGYFESFERNALPALLLLGLWMLVMVKLIIPLFSLRGRREWLGRWRRILRWEFWPPWIFYAPVVVYVLGLGLRHRSPLLFTAANPAIPAGGFIGESKRDILEGLAAAGERIARSGWLPHGAKSRSRSALHWMGETNTAFPVVLKPDAGQRGSGVVIVHDREQLDRYLDAATFDVIIQEYVPGEEFGVFYYRLPGEEQGRIFSITEKKLPILVGDGVQTLEELILNDPRAVCMAGYYFQVQQRQLGRVPARGETVRLVELGTHCRGAIFLDGASHNTESLRRAIDEISLLYEGFYFGRYDIRVPDAEQLRLGRNLKIIELNGVTSEATHIYDPAVRLRQAYATLFEQWRIAFEIGKRNRDCGCRVVSLRELLQLLFRYRASSAAVDAVGQSRY